jgi:replicative DNA helicase
MVDDVAAIVNEEAKAIAENLKLFYPTGLREIDTRWGGLSNEGPTLLIGISGHGKTSTLNRLGFGLCCNGFGVYTHATEASKEQRIRDIVYSVAGLNQIEARSDPDKKAVVDRLNRAGQMVADLTWDVSGSGMGLQDICARIRAGAMAGKVDVAFIDYLQDIPAQGSEGRMSRTEWVGHCSQTFKDLCAEVQIPIVMGAQATKPLLVDAKINPRPGMYSTQWSSKPAQDAEEVYTLYYNDAMKAEYGEAWTIPGLPGVIEITKRKARRTKLSTVEVDFNGNVRWLGEPAMP